jgi:predicted nuclease with TOPRIM domain
MSKIKGYVIAFFVILTIAFVGATIKRADQFEQIADQFEQKYLDMKEEVRKENERKRVLLEAQDQANTYQSELTSKLNKIAAKNAVLNRHYDAFKGTYECKRPADAKQVIMQGVCDYADATGGGCE